MAGVDTDHNVTVPPAKPRRGGAGARGSVREQLVDGRHAIRELIAAVSEMEGVPEGLSKWERRAAMVEPMSRINLVRKFCENLLHSNGVKFEAVR
jgi:hypothetical protein